MSIVFLRKVFILLIVAVGSTAGCGENIFENLADTESTASKIEAAQIALSSSDYDTAILILQEVCGTDLSNPTCDAETRALLASAYSGRAGLDVINLIRKASTEGLTSFGSFSSLLPTSTPANQTDLNNALTLLTGIASRTEDQNLQMAVTAVADIIVTIGVDLNATFDPQTGLPSSSPDPADIPIPTLTRISNDVVMIVDGVAGSGLTTDDLAIDINQIKSDLAGTDSNVSAGELHDFLCDLDPSASGCP